MKPQLESIRDGFLVIITFPVLIACIGIFGLCYLALCCWFAAGEVIDHYLGKRKLWTCAWCKCVFKKGGIKVKRPEVGRLQGHGMCAECAAREFAKMENMR